MKLSRLMMAPAIAMLAALPAPAFAQAFTVTDVAGREVSFDAPVQRAILGEGRLLYSLATIETENPFAHVVGWRNDLWTTDTISFDAYVEKFPEAADLPFRQPNRWDVANRDGRDARSRRADPDDRQQGGGR